MIYAVKTDFIPLLENLVASLLPFAMANFVQLRFESGIQKIEISYHPESILPDLTHLLCQVITFTPQGCEVVLKAKLQDERVILQVVNSGATLDHMNEIGSGLGQKTTVSQTGSNGTIFEFSLSAGEGSTGGRKSDSLAILGKLKYSVPPFFKKLSESLHAHFTSLKNLEQAAGERSPAEGVFLKKVNAAILAHMEDERFDMPALSKVMALSRSQLYRRLKPLVRQSPAHYIKFVRLQKAKEMMDNPDCSIGEIAFQTGFLNQSHFTRAFREQFGFNPSDVRRKKIQEQNDSKREPQVPQATNDLTHIDS
jgi:AraC-like DNA-binding protein